LQTLSTYFEVSASLGQVQAVIAEAVQCAEGQFTMADAIGWATDPGTGPFRIPQAAIDSDFRLYQAHQRDFDQMMRRRLAQIRPHRLNEDRIAAVISRDNPEWGKLMDLAAGIQIPTPATFVPNGQGKLPDLRKNYRIGHAVVNKLIHEQHEQGLAIYLPMEVAVREIAGCNFSPTDLVIDGKRRKGRNTIDPASLNGPETRESTTTIYGEIHHPDLLRIMLMVLLFFRAAKLRDPSLTWDMLRMWKMDLKGAFTLMSVRAEKAKLFGVELLSDEESARTIAVFFLGGTFGWGGTPAAFAVITRAIVFELARITRGSADMYVDDIIGVCLEVDVDHDQEKARALCTKLLGDAAVAEEKTERFLRGDVIGYTIDLLAQRVTISHKNAMRALYGFFSASTWKRNSRSRRLRR
jgi:hypothetical protein